MNTRLAAVAAQEAAKFWHGTVQGAETNLHPISALFPASPAWDVHSWDDCWYAAFVYYCVRQAGIDLPCRWPDPRVSCNFAGCLAWEEWAKLPWIDRWVDAGCPPEPGDLVLFDRVARGEAHDHIGIVVEVKSGCLRTAEGNFGNVSAMVSRPMDGHIRGYVRM